MNGLGRPSIDLLELNEVYLAEEDPTRKDAIAEQIKAILVPELTEVVQVAIQEQGKSGARQSLEALQEKAAIEQDFLVDFFVSFLVNPALSVADIPETCMPSYLNLEALIDENLEEALKVEGDDEEPQELVFE